MVKERAEKETKIEQEPMRIARAVLVAPIPVSEMFAQLGRGKPISEISFSEIVLIQKSNQSIPSPRLVMPVGGEVVPGKSSIEDVLREVGEETTVTSLAEEAAKHRWARDKKMGKKPPFTFYIPGNDQPRYLDMFVLPIQSRSFSVHKRRERKSGPKSEDKIKRVIRFTPGELNELIDKGSITREGTTIKAAEHFTTAEDPGFKISEEGKIKRSNTLESVKEDVDAFELSLRQATLLTVNRVRRIRAREQVSDLSGCSPEEITSGFVGAQLRMALLDERIRELEPGPHMLDSVLKIIPYLASKLPAEELSSLLLSVPNKEARKAINLLRSGFAKGADVIVSRFSADKEQEQRKDDNCYEDKLRSVWTDFLALPIAERIALLEQANEKVLQEIVLKSPGFIRADIENALSAVDNWHSYITNEVRGIQDIFQQYHPMNEVSNSLLFTKMIYTLGLHPNVGLVDNDQDELRRLRFEAARGLADFIVKMEAAKMHREADVSIFQAAFDKLFKFPPTAGYIKLDKDREQPVFHRETAFEIGGRALDVLVDERERKSLLSVGRKRYQSPVVNDIFSVNFVLADSNFEGSNDPFNDRLQAAEEFGDNFLLNLAEQFVGTGWAPSILKGTHTRGAIEKAKAFWEGDRNVVFAPRMASGKRAGSKGDSIVREKFILCAENENGQKQTIEVCIYPFESTGSGQLKYLKQAGYWGFAEKLLDDYEGNYKAERIVKRDDKHPTVPSLWERLYPRRFYPTLFDRMRQSHVTSRRTRERLARTTIQ